MRPDPSILQAAQSIARDPFGYRHAQRIAEENRRAVVMKPEQQNPTEAPSTPQETPKSAPPGDQHGLHFDRGYGRDGEALHFTLDEYSDGYTGLITNNLSDRTVFLQGDDFEQVRKDIEDIQKQLRWKKIGKAKAQQLQDELLSQYFE